MPEYHGPDPVVEITDVTEVARDLVVVPNRHIDLVPNIGVIGGTRSVLIIDTGLGPRSAEKVLNFAAGYAKGRRLYLTTTHFHPEHAFGAGLPAPVDGGLSPWPPGGGLTPSAQEFELSWMVTPRMSGGNHPQSREQPPTRTSSHTRPAARTTKGPGGIAL